MSNCFEGSGKEGPIKCIFLSEFHPVVGPKIICQVPNGYISKDVFESVSVYVIPKPQLLGSILTIALFEIKILGFPMRIDDKKYARNAYYFNLCFVFDIWARSVQYETVLKKLTNYLTTMEMEHRFLSYAYGERRVQLTNILSQVMNDLNTEKMCILSEGKNMTYLKITTIYPDPPAVLDHQVPVLVESLESYQAEQWDLTTYQILPHVNGVDHVAKIAASADVDISLVKSCLQNLVIVEMVPIFQYSGMYAATPDLHKLAMSTNLQMLCISAVARTDRQLPTFRDVFRLYSSMRCGVTIKDLCIKYNPIELHIDERNLVQFGIMEKFIRKIYKYPVIFEESTTVDNMLYSQYLTGEYSTDEICCITGLGIQELEEQIDAYPNVTFIYK